MYLRMKEPLSMHYPWPLGWLESVFVGTMHGALNKGLCSGFTLLGLVHSRMLCRLSIDIRQTIDKKNGTTLVKKEKRVSPTD